MSDEMKVSSSAAASAASLASAYTAPSTRAVGSQQQPAHQRQNHAPPTSPIHSQPSSSSSSSSAASGQRHDRTQQLVLQPLSPSAAVSAFQPRTQIRELSSGAASSSNHPIVNAREPWEVDYSEIEIDSRTVVGEGYFGVVHKARWREMIVCAKKLKNVRSGELSNFIQEVQLCSRLRHPHLVQFLGASTDRSNLCILTEWMSGGSLYSWIHDHTTISGVKYRKNDYPTLLRISSEIVRALIYLHGSHIIHRDLTTSNILLDGKLTCKVGDFGLSRGEHDPTSGMGGNLNYLAPEAFLLSQYSEKSDVFAFAVVLNELLTGQVPFKGVNSALAASEVANRGARPQLSPSTPIGFVRLIVACWNHDPTQRPTFRMVLQTLEELEKEMGGATNADEHPGATRPASSSGDSDLPTPTSRHKSHSGSGGKEERNSGEGRKKNGKMKRIPSERDVNLTPVQTPTSSSKSSKSKRSSSSAAPTHPAPSAFAASSAAGSYDRPHTPDSDAGGDASSEYSTVSTPPQLTRSKSSSQPAPIISPNLNITPKDIRLFLVCLKKHLPAHDTFILHKPSLSAIDIFCETSGTSKKYAKAVKRSGASTSEGSAVASDVQQPPTPYRSRSEGDEDAANAKPRPHACSPSFISSMYPSHLPSIGELVVCRAKRCEESGAMYELMEYTQPQVVGMAQVQELTKRKMRSISKLVTLGQIDVLRVLHVDRERGFVDLSKKDVNEQVRSSVLTYYQLASTAHACILHAAKLLNVCSYCLYFNVIWPLSGRYENSVYKFLRLSLVSPILTLSEYRECACLARYYQSMITQVTASTTSAATTAFDSSLYILSSPRVLPELTRRTDYHRVHLNLSRLALEELPKQLIDDESDTSAPAAGSATVVTLDDSTSSTTAEPPTSSSSASSQSYTNPPHSNGKSRRNMRAASNASSSTARRSTSDRSHSLLNSLRSLNLEENPLRTLSSNLGKFSKLQELNINNCKLTSLPLELNHCQSIQRLYGFGNHFQSIPSVIKTLKQLTQLNLSANKITSIEENELSSLTSLLELSLAHNRISSIAATNSLPDSLQTVDLSNNCLNSFPKVLYSLPQLISIELKHNEIVTIPTPQPSASTSPSTSSPFLYLEWLDCSHNKLTSIYPQLFSQCMYITWINLSNNHLTGLLPESMWQLLGKKEDQANPNHSGEDESKHHPTLPHSHPHAHAHAHPTNTTETHPTSPVGLMYLNIQHNPHLKACETLEKWNELVQAIPQFVYDEPAVPSVIVGKEISVRLTPIVHPMSHPQINSTPQLVPMPASSAASSSAASSTVQLMHTWSVAQVSAWLRTEGFAEFIPAFEENLITGATLLELDKSDLRDDLGVRALGTQKKLLKLIQTQKDAIQATLMSSASTSAAPTPNSVSLQATPHMHSLNTAHSDNSLSSLSLGPRAIETASTASMSGAPPSVPVRRVNSSSSTLSPSTSMVSINNSIGAAAGLGCEQRTCERVKSMILRAAISSEPMCRPVLLRCVVVLLIGTVYTAENARVSLDAALAAGRAASIATGGVISAPFRGLHEGARSHVTIAALIEPLYLLSLSCLMPTEGITLIETCVSAMNRALDERGCGGRVKVTQRPYIVDLITPELLPATPTHQQQSSSASSSAAVTALSDSTPSLHRTKSSTASIFSGEILAALQMFQAASQEAADEQRARKEENAKRRKEKREKEKEAHDRGEGKKKKKDRTQAAAAEESEPKPSITDGAFD